MRNLSEVEQIIADAKINYSYRIQLYEQDLERGIPDQDWDLLFAAKNIFDTDLDLITTIEQNALCDWLLRNQFTLSENNLLFSEGVFNDQAYDIIT